MDDSNRKYRKYDLPLPEDTTAHDPRTLLTPGFLRFVGELLFGERWQTPLAQCLGKVRGKMLAPATVHRWSTVTRSIPDWVTDALAVALENGQRELNHRADMARDVARRIRTPLSCDNLKLPDEEQQHRRYEDAFDRACSAGLHSQEGGRDKVS